jgi:hypothetical protein
MTIMSYIAILGPPARVTYSPAAKITHCDYIFEGVKMRKDVWEQKRIEAQAANSLVSLADERFLCLL